MTLGEVSRERADHVHLASFTWAFGRWTVAGPVQYLACPVIADDYRPGNPNPPAAHQAIAFSAGSLVRDLNFIPAIWTFEADHVQRPLDPPPAILLLGTTRGQCGWQNGCTYTR